MPKHLHTAVDQNCWQWKGPATAKRCFEEGVTLVLAFAPVACTRRTFPVIIYCFLMSEPTIPKPDGHADGGLAQSSGHIVVYQQLSRHSMTSFRGRGRLAEVEDLQLTLVIMVTANEDGDGFDLLRSSTYTALLFTSPTQLARLTAGEAERPSSLAYSSYEYPTVSFELHKLLAS